MSFKDWDSQRAAKNEVSKDGREEVKKKATREEKVCFQQSGDQTVES